MKLEEYLDFYSNGERSTALPRHVCALVTDSLESRGMFLLVHFVAQALTARRQVVFVSFSTPQEQLQTICKKAGVQLQNRLNFVDASSHVLNAGENLAALRQEVQGKLGEGTLVVFDDVSNLIWAGCAARAVLALIRAARNDVSEQSGSLLALMHADDVPGDLEDDYLFRHLLAVSDIWLQASTLGSQTRGELAIHRGPALLPHETQFVARSGAVALQYKLEDRGGIFSVKGSGRGFIG